MAQKDLVPFVGDGRKRASPEHRGSVCRSGPRFGARATPDAGALACSSVLVERGGSRVSVPSAVSNHRRTTGESQRLADQRWRCGDAKGLWPERDGEGRDLEAATRGAERSRDRAAARASPWEREQPPGENGRYPAQGPPALPYGRQRLSDARAPAPPLPDASISTRTRRQHAQ